MGERFAGLRKIPRQPAARLLAVANARLQVPLKAPASAPVEVVLAELEGRGAVIDMLRLLSVALPVRERVWWACLAARDTLPEGAPVPPPLAAAEAWVFRPGEETRAAAMRALEAAPPEDDTVHCVTGILYCDGTLGPGALAEHPAPPGAGEVAAFAMNLVALGARADEFAAHAERLVERALDIARGGSGRLEEKTGEETA